jgi:putative nucleotidyltransferase with HDIG domain
MPTINWTGLLVFVVLAFTLELVATEIYSRDASVSTSVAPIIGAMMAFGIVGALLTCLAVATVTQFRTHKPINRFIFNISNHLISSGLCLLFLHFGPIPLIDWPLPLQVGFALGASIVIYLSSTGLLAGVLSLSTGQPLIHIWQEKFKWLGLHYVALGSVAFVLFYSYITVGAFSVVILLVPLAMLHFSQHQYIKATKSMVEQLNQNNQILSNRNQEVQRLNDELLLALASTIDLRDPFVVEHSRHVARYAAVVAEELGLSPARTHLVYQAGLIHDIGKLAIPEAILFKPGRLTNDEYEVIKEHVTVGADLLDDFQSLQSVGTFVRHHHERYDGRGYPEGLAGEDIPLEARILALADAVEAMASDRPYRPGSSVEAILKEIRHEAGAQFDPRVVEAFISVVHKQGDATIVNSARNIELPELKSNAGLREEFASWTTPKDMPLSSDLSPHVGSFTPPQVFPNTSA